MRLPHWRINSILSLLLIGFVIVLLPLTFAAIYSEGSLDNLTKQSQKVVRQAVYATRLTQRTSDLLIDIERTARQYQLLNNEKLLDLFRRQDKALERILSELKAFELPEQTREAIGRIESDVAALGDALGQGPESEQLEIALGRFEDLSQVSTDLTLTTEKFVDSRLRQLEDEVVELQTDILVLGLTVIPITFGLILVFSNLVASPIRQLDKAIHQLGNANFEQEVQVKGPKDLRHLGTLLDWLRRRLLELEQQKARFLRHMSHELKTPLAVLREGSDLLADEIPGKLDEDQRSVVELLQQNTRELQNRIENLLDYNLIQSNVQLRLEDVDLLALVNNIVNAYRLTIRNRNLNIDLPDETLILQADRSKLRASLDNLVSNAVSFCSRSGTISINWSQTEQRTEITVTDDGPGIKEEERTNLFEPFYQGSARRSGAVKGSGIGLSVARECIQAHGGLVSVSNKEGRGACFTIELPVSELSAKSAV